MTFNKVFGDHPDHCYGHRALDHLGLHSLLLRRHHLLFLRLYLGILHHLPRGLHYHHHLRLLRLNHHHHLSVFYNDYIHFSMQSSCYCNPRIGRNSQIIKIIFYIHNYSNLQSRSNLLHVVGRHHYFHHLDPHLYRLHGSYHLHVIHL